MQETWVNPWSRNIPHAMEQLSHNYWTCALQPKSCNYRAHMLQLMKPVCPKACALQQKKLLQWEVHSLTSLLKKSPKCIECKLRNDRMISVCFQVKPFNITVIQVYAQTTNAKKAEVEWFYEDLQYLLELTPKKMSRDKWSCRQLWLWSTKWSRSKANRLLPRECTGHSKHLLPTTQEKTLHMDITIWLISKSDWLYSL